MANITNTSNSEEHQSVTGHYLSTTEVIIALTCIFIADIFIIVANTFVISAFYHDKTLRIPRNFYICNLALCDLIVGIFIVPIYSTTIAFGDWRLGQAFCIIWTVVNHVILFVSHLSIMLVAYDRYKIVKDAVKYNANENIYKAKVKIGFTWITVLAIKLLLILPTEHFYISKHAPLPSCSPWATVSIPYIIGLKPYDITMSTLGMMIEVFLPILIVTAFHWKVLQSIKKRMEKNNTVITLISTSLKLNAVTNMELSDCMTLKSSAEEMKDIDNISGSIPAAGTSILGLERKPLTRQLDTKHMMAWPLESISEIQSYNNYNYCSNIINDHGSPNLQQQKYNVKQDLPKSITVKFKNENDDNTDTNLCNLFETPQSRHSHASTKKEKDQISCFLKYKEKQNCVLQEQVITTSNPITNENSYPVIVENTKFKDLRNSNKTSNCGTSSENQINFDSQLNYDKLNFYSAQTYTPNTKLQKPVSTSSPPITNSNKVPTSRQKLPNNSKSTKKIFRKSCTKVLKQQPMCNLPSQHKQQVQKPEIIEQYRKTGDQKAVVTITLLILFFVLFKLPLAIVIINTAICPQCITIKLFQSLLWVFWAKSIPNPFLYAFISKKFRLFTVTKYKKFKRRLRHSNAIFLIRRSNRVGNLRFEH